MLSNRLAFAVLGIVCVAAAAGGGYLGTRQNAIPAPASAQTAATTPAPAASTAAVAPARPGKAEAIVGSPKAAPPAPAAETVRRPEAPTRTARAANTSTAATSRQTTPPPLSSTWPTSAASQPPAPQPPPPVEPAPAPRPGEAIEPIHTPEPPRAAVIDVPPQKTFEDLVIQRDSVIGLQTENRVSSETARVEDRVDARVTRDVRVGDRVAIPAGSRAIGSVSLVERGGRLKERARLGLRFHTLVLADGTRVPMNTETIYREGESPSNSSASKIGGAAVGGAIIGAILGGGKGAAIGATAGASAGSVAVAAGDRSAVVVLPGTALTARINQPVTITIEK